MKKTLKRKPNFNLKVRKDNRSNMNWKQAKKRYPKMSPYGDADLDGSYNKIDCKPFDPSRDGVFSRFIGYATKGVYGQSKQAFKKEMALKRKIAKSKEKQKLEILSAREKQIKKILAKKKQLELLRQKREVQRLSQLVRSRR